MLAVDEIFGHLFVFKTNNRSGLAWLQYEKWVNDKEEFRKKQFMKDFKEMLYKYGCVDFKKQGELNQKRRDGRF